MTDDLALLVDIGSTYTKVVAVDLSSATILGRTEAATTVSTSVAEGLVAALRSLTLRGRTIDAATVAKARKLASSSAAGGLAVVAVGLVPDLTVQAATKAALGAGARVTSSYAFELDDGALAEIEGSACDIILLVGGIDGGNSRVILHNARAIAASTIDAPIVVAGNATVGRQAADVLEAAGKRALLAANVLPALDRLNVEPARECIRQVFLDSIVHAKGLDQAQEIIGDLVMPTPMATLKGASLLADGHAQEAGLGELMVVEIGGATTNVHSVAAGTSEGSNTVVKGLPEPYEMRTVEGDLGIRYNAATILDVVGINTLTAAMPDRELSEERLRQAVTHRSSDVAFLPGDDTELAVDVALARCATAAAVERHCGRIREAWGPSGVVRVQQGKDLSAIRTVIGTGGVLAHSRHPGRILSACLSDAARPWSLRPVAPSLLVDSQYVLYGVGLLRGLDPHVALSIGLEYMRPVTSAA